MLRIELATQLRRPWSLILFALLIALPSVAAATQAGGRGHAATSSSLNFAESGLNFMDPVLFGLVVSVFGSILGGADREWGTLRYLYTRPVSRARLVAGKAWALWSAPCSPSLHSWQSPCWPAIVAFGWHPFHRAGANDLSYGSAIWTLAGCAGYLAICLLSIGTIALTLGLLLPRSVEALAVSTAFLIGATMIDNIRALHGLVVILPVHYWMRWTQLLRPDNSGSELIVGLAVQAATVAIAVTVAYTLLSRRDPAA